MHKFSWLIFLLFPTLVFSQNLSGVLNKYAKITALDTCSGQLTVSSTDGFSAGMSVLLIQMQGATINSSDNSSFGIVTALGSAGLFEKNEIASVGSSTTLFLKFKTIHSFNFSGSVQLVSFPKFTHAVVTDTLFPKKWDGETGGILALQAQKLTCHAPLDASAAGFRGAKSISVAGNNCNWAISQNDYWYAASSWRAALKGEGIAPIIVGKEAGRGPQANGGGGGNDHNSGGGGGGNGQNGGRGGDNDEPSTFNCDGYNPGLGGRAIVVAANENRLFLGGGGGAGHGNNALGGDGGAGGGLIFLEADSLDGSKIEFFANGAAGGLGQADGAGGGGAAGSLFFWVGAAPNSTVVQADGGNGGMQDVLQQNRCFGPGGGGAGGSIFLKNALPNVVFSMKKGAAGTVFNSTAGCNGSSNGGTAGSDGSSKTIQNGIPQSFEPVDEPQILTQPTDQTACEGELAIFEISMSGAISGFQWQQNLGSGWVDISQNDSLFIGQNSMILIVKSANLAQNGVQFRCLIQPMTTCFSEKMTTAATLSVFPKPSASFQFQVQNGLVVVFQNQSQNQTGLAWNFGDGSPTTDQPNPSHQFSQAGNFTVSLTVWNGCDTVVSTKTVVVDALPVAAFTLPDSIFACGNSTILTFQNGSVGFGQSFLWLFPGASPSQSTDVNPSVTYSSSGSYAVSLIATNAVGSDTLTQFFQLIFEQQPMAKFTTTQAGNTIHCQNQSTGAGIFTWNFNDGTPAVHDANPSHGYPWAGDWVVTLVVQNSCGADILEKNIHLQPNATEENWAEKWGLRVFPNPTDGLILVEFSTPPNGPILMQLIDFQGKNVFEKMISEKTTTLDLSDWPAGVFVLKIRSASGQAVRQVVKF